MNMKVRGLVNPIAWDKKGAPTKFSLFTPDEEDIVIEDSSYRRNFQNLLNKEVIAQGELHQNLHGEKMIKIDQLRSLGHVSHFYKTKKKRQDDWSDETFHVNLPRSFEDSIFI